MSLLGRFIPFIALALAMHAVVLWGLPVPIQPAQLTTVVLRATLLPTWSDPGEIPLVPSREAKAAQIISPSGLRTHPTRHPSVESLSAGSEALPINVPSISVEQSVSRGSSLPSSEDAPPAPKPTRQDGTPNEPGYATTSTGVGVGQASTGKDYPLLEQPNGFAQYLNNPRPPYPRMSQKLKESGTVLLRVLVDTTGAVPKVEVAQSSGYLRLDQQSQETVLASWKFIPGKRNGVPQAMWVVVPIRFE